MGRDDVLLWSPRRGGDSDSRDAQTDQLHLRVQSEQLLPAGKQESRHLRQLG